MLTCGRILSFLIVLHLFTNVHAQEAEFKKTWAEIQNNKLDDTAKVKSLIYLSNLYQAKNLDTAIFYGNKAIHLAAALNDYPLLVHASNQQASNYTWQEKYDTALHIYFRSINIASTHKITSQLASTYINLAYLYEVTEIWEKAAQYSRKALEIYVASGSEENQAYAYHELGGVCLGTNSFIEAEKYLQKAKLIFKKYANEDRYATCMMDLGRLYIQMSRYPEASSLLDSSIKIFTKLDEPLQNAEAFQLLGDLYADLHNIKLAENYYNDALKLFEENKMEERKYNVYMGISDVATQSKNYKRAKILLTETYAWAKLHGDDELQLQAVSGLIKTDSALGLIKEAFSFINQYQILSDTVYKTRREQYTRQLLVEYEVADTEKENQLLRQENTRTKEESFIFLITCIVFLLVAALVLLSYRQKNKLNRALVAAQQQTEIANKELQSINQVKDKLFSIMAHDLRAPLANTLQLLQLMKKGEIQQDDFNRFAGYLESDLVYNNDLLENLLNWARSQMNGITVNKSRIHLHSLIEENCTLFQFISSKKQIKLVNLIPTDVFILADENIMRLALRNTVSNAIKFSKPDTEVHMECVAETGKVRIAIRDEGVGVTESQKKKIFSLEAVSTYGTDKEKGAGIGLRITYEMLQKTDGEIWIENNDGDGTSVFLQVDRA